MITQSSDASCQDQTHAPQQATRAGCRIDTFAVLAARARELFSKPNRCSRQPQPIRVLIAEPAPPLPGRPVAASLSIQAATAFAALRGAEVGAERVDRAPSNGRRKNGSTPHLQAYPCFQDV